MINVSYSLWGMLAGLIGGAVAATFFKRLWKLLGGEDGIPMATDCTHGWLEVVLVPSLQGAVLGAIRAFVGAGGGTGQRPGQGAESRKES